MQAAYKYAEGCYPELPRQCLTKRTHGRMPPANAISFLVNEGQGRDGRLQSLARLRSLAPERIPQI